MVHLTFSIRQTDPLEIIHRHGRFGRVGTLAVEAFGTLAGDHSEIHRSVSSTAGSGIDVAVMLQQHIRDEHPVFWSVADMQALEDEARTLDALTGRNWLQYVRQDVDLFPAEALAYGRLRYWKGDKPEDKPTMALALFLDKPLLQPALDLLLESRRLSEAHFVVRINLQGPKHPNVDLPLPTVDDFVRGAPLYGTEVSWGFDSGELSPRKVEEHAADAPRPPFQALPPLSDGWLVRHATPLLLLAILFVLYFRW